MSNRIAMMGVSGLYHDSAVVILCDDRIVRTSRKKRFTPNKHDSRTPIKERYFLIEHRELRKFLIGWLGKIAFHNDSKKWRLFSIGILLLVMGVMVLLSSSAIALYI